MKKAIALIALGLLSAALAAPAIKPCEELKDEIDKKLQAKGSKNYTLEIVDKDKQSDAQVVGTCDGGSKKILYSKGEAAAKKEASPAMK